MPQIEPVSTIQSSLFKFRVGTQGNQSITLTSYLNLQDPCNMTPGTYRLNLNVNGGGAADVAFIISSSAQSWQEVIDAINVAFTGVTVSLVSGVQFVLTSETYGPTSTIAVLDGTTTGFLAALLAQKAIGSTINASTAGVDDIATSGYAEISNTGTLATFGSAVVPALPSATYDLDVTADSTLRQVATALLVTDTWAQIAAKIQVALRALTTSTETVAIVNGKIKVTSATSGIASSILIAAGTAGSGGGDLLAAIDAIGATYVTSLDAPVDGFDGIVFTVEPSASVYNPKPEPDSDLTVKSLAGAIKTNALSMVWSETAGTFTISSTITTDLTSGDLVTLKLI